MGSTWRGPRDRFEGAEHARENKNHTESYVGRTRRFMGLVIGRAEANGAITEDFSRKLIMWLPHRINKNNSSMNRQKSGAKRQHDFGIIGATATDHNTSPGDCNGGVGRWAMLFEGGGTK